MINSNKKKANREKNLFITFMLAWSVLHFVVFWVYTNANTFFLAFFKFNTSTATYEWYGFTRFIKIFKDMILGEDFILANNLKNSLWCFPVQNFIILPLSFFSAFFLFKKVPFSNAFRVIFFLPSMLSVVVLAMSFKYMFNVDFGPISVLLSDRFGLKEDWFSSMSSTAMPLVFTFGVWAELGYDIVLLNGAMERVPQEIIEAAKLDGANIGTEMFKIILPLTMPTISTLFILGSLGVVSYYLQPMLLCGTSGGVNGNTGTVALRVISFIEAGATEDAAAIGLFFSLIGIPFVLLIKWGINKLVPDVEY